MDIQILNKDERKITFLLKDTTPQFANAVRRIAMSEVPTLAVSEVSFSKNDSALYDELIAHRFALVPLVFDSKEFNMPEDCKCEGGCSSCQVVFAVNKKGPCTVYTKDIKSSNKDVKPLYDNIPLVELKEGQLLKLEATAMLGIGRTHAKHTSAVSFYRYYPNVKLNGTLQNTEVTVKSCPKNVLRIEGNKAQVTSECDLCKECVNTAIPEGVLEITGDDRNFVFTVESVSGLTANQIIMLTLDILKKKAKEFENKVSKL